MRRPETCATVLLGLLTVATANAQVPEGVPRDWYRVELLVFARDDAESLGAEQWAPLPELAYPEKYRHLVDPALVERRLAESGAFASAVDGRGVQVLTVPAPVEALERLERPDALINEPWVDEEAVASTSIGAAPDSPDMPVQTTAGAEPELTPLPDDGAALSRTLLALPYQLLDEGSLDFRSEAGALRQRGERVLFHGSWWAPLPEGGESLPLVLDRSADPDVRDWPSLQGSVYLYRARYLHIDVNLWLNTMAPYLPEGWQIPAPPRPAPTLVSRTLAGKPLNPWAPLPAGPETGESALPPGPISADADASDPVLRAPGDSAAAAGAATPDAVIPEGDVENSVTHPWRHAIVHRQSRRMRSDEIHYLDHPVIGVIVRVRPVNETLLPIADDAELTFRERHALPAVYVGEPVDSDPGG